MILCVSVGPIESDMSVGRYAFVSRTGTAQGQAEKIAKNLESQLAELNAKLDQSARELADLNAFKSRSQADNAELARQLEEAEGTVAQLTRLKQTANKQLDEAKAALEEESRLRAKLTAENRNLQVYRSSVIGPILWLGHSGPLCHALSFLSLLSLSSLLWTSMRRRRATVAACDSSDTWWMEM